MARTSRQRQLGWRRDPILRRLATRLIVGAGIARLWRVTARRGVPLVVYFHEVTHATRPPVIPSEPLLRIEPALFTWVLARLAQRFRFASLEQVVASPNSSSVAVTFDEGYRGVYQHGFPVLKKYNIPATVFLTTGHVGTNRLLWWDRLLLQARKAQECGPEAAQRLGALEPQIMGGDGRIDEHRLLLGFKAMSRLRRDEVWRVLDDLAGAATSRERIFVSEDEIREMAAAGIQFGAHTRTHPLLTWLNDTELMDEVAGSKADVEHLAGTEATWFAYPDGMFGDREMAIARGAGFRGAVQTWRYPWRRGRYAVPRVGLTSWTVCGGSTQPDAARMEMTLAGLTRRTIHSIWRKDSE